MVWFKYGVHYDDQSPQNPTVIVISYEKLRMMELKKLYECLDPKDKRTVLKQGRFLAANARLREKQMNISLLEKLIVDDLKKRSSVAVEADKDDEPLNRHPKPIEHKEKRDNPPKLRKKKKPVAQSSGSAPGKKNPAAVSRTTQIRTGYVPLAQDPQRFKSIDKIPVLPTPTIKPAAASQSESFVKVPSESPLQKKEHSPDRLPIGKVIQERDVLEQLLLLVAEMQRVVDIKVQFYRQLDLACKAWPEEIQLQCMTHVVGWHYLHDQICNLLAMLDDRHLAKAKLFDAITYYEQRTYDRQKHKYMPRVLPSQIFDDMVQDLAGIKAVLSVLSEGYEPLSQSVEQAQPVIKNWSRYIESEFAQNDLFEQTKGMSPDQFGKWVVENILGYTARVKQLLLSLHTIDENDSDMRFVVQLAIRFYMTRIGELAGHIPNGLRSSFLREARQFRNAAAHTYSKKQVEPLIDEPKLVVSELDEQLQHEQPINAITTWQFYVNKHYGYRENELVALTYLRMRQVLNNVNQPVGLVVNEAVHITTYTNLYSLLAAPIKNLAQQMEQEKQPVGLLLMPVMCYGDKVKLHARIQGVLSTVALKFVNNDDDALMIEICYASVVSQQVIIDGCMQVLPSNWAANCPQKNTPTVRQLISKTLDVHDRENFAVLQVELLVQLAERRLIADELLDRQLQSKLPISAKKAKTTDEKSRKLASLLIRLRQNHIALSRSVQHDDPVMLEFYYRQQLIKPQRQEVTAVSFPNSQD